MEGSRGSPPGAPTRGENSRGQAVFASFTNPANDVRLPRGGRVERLSDPSGRSHEDPIGASTARPRCTGRSPATATCRCAGAPPRGIRIHWHVFTVRKHFATDLHPRVAVPPAVPAVPSAPALTVIPRPVIAPRRRQVHGAPQPRPRRDGQVHHGQLRPERVAGGPVAAGVALRSTRLRSVASPCTEVCATSSRATPNGSRHS